MTEVITRKEAKESGLKKYFTGKMCPHGHVSERYVSGGNCIECLDGFVVSNPDKVKRANRAWYIKNLDKVKEARRRYYLLQYDSEKQAAKNRKRYASNPEKYRARAKRWRLDNPDKLREQWRRKRINNIEKERERSKRWKLSNPDTVAAHNRNRKARKRGNGGSHTAMDVLELFSKQNGKCTYCQVRITAKYHVDHKTPISRGGSNDRTNLQILCVPCNLKKHTRTHEEYLMVLEVYNAQGLSA